MPSLSLLRAASLAGLAAAQTTTLVDTLWVPFAHPASVEASIVSIRPDPSEVELGDSSVVTFALACPSASSPENDACRAAGIYPQLVTHTDGPWFEGAITAGPDATTSWSCELAGNPGSSDLSADCTTKVFAKIGAGTTTTKLRSCAVEAGFIPVLLTAGDLAGWTNPFGTPDPVSWVDAYTSTLDADLKALGCPARTVMTVAAGQGSVMAQASATGQPATGSQAGSKATGSLSQVTASGPASASSSSAAAASQHDIAGIVRLGAVAASLFALLA
jgi:hypothetical protein